MVRYVTWLAVQCCGKSDGAWVHGMTHRPGILRHRLVHAGFLPPRALICRRSGRFLQQLFIHLTIVCVICTALLTTAAGQGAVPEVTEQTDVDTQKVVEGIGAIVRRNQAAARQQAIRDALRRALEREVGVLIDPLVLMEKATQLETQLYTRSLIYIRSYRVLWEYPDVAQKVYRVGVEAEVAVDEVAKEIQALDLSQPGGEEERLLVLVQEDHLGRQHMSTVGHNGGVVARVLRQRLQEQGFRMVSLQDGPPWDGGDGSALETAKRVGAGVVLIGEARAQKVRGEVAGMALQAVQAHVEILALQTTTGEQLALEQADSTAFHADAILGGTQALEKAATSVAERLSSPLHRYQQQHQKRTIDPSRLP